MVHKKEAEFALYKRLGRIDLKKAWILIFLLFFLSVIWNLMEPPLVTTVLVFAVCVFVSYKFDIPKFPLFLGLIALFIRVMIVVVFKTPAVSDFGVLLDASRSLLEGDKSYLDTKYFQLWSYQNGFVAYQSLLLTIWNSTYVLKLANCVFSSATVVLVYLLAREFASERASRMISLVYCFLPFSLFYVTVLTNQFLASFLIYLGLYILISQRIKMKGHFKYLIFAVLLSLANMIRPESIIPLFSVVLFLVLTIDKSNFKENLLHIAILVVTYLGLNWLLSQFFIITGLSPNGLTNNAPHWKFVLGFNHNTSGTYTNGDGGYLMNEAAAWEAVRDRICVPFSQLMDLFEKKIRIFWDGSGLNWPLGHFLQTGVTVFGTTFRISDNYAVWQDVSKYTMITLYLLVVIGVFKYIKQQNWNKYVLLFANQVFVTFGVYLLIEVQSRYAYHIQISIAILAALGVHAIRDCLARRKKECISQ